MRRIFRWIGHGGGAAAQQDDASPGVTAEQVAAVLDHFPIGSRVQYHPEFQDNAGRDTVILACHLDELWVYTAHDLLADRGTGTLRVNTVDGDERVLAGADAFYLAVPHLHREELDYGPGGEPTRKLVNDFQRGSAITLRRRGPDGRIAQVVCTVVRGAGLRSGYFAGRRVACLAPDPATLSVVEQRELHRIPTRIPATLSVDRDEPGRPCAILDFSERYLRVAVDGEPPPTPRAVIRIDLPDGSRSFVLRCKIHRSEENQVVLAVTGILKNRRFQPLEVVDELDFKTSLLHHPDTHRVLVGDGGEGGVTARQG